MSQKYSREYVLGGAKRFFGETVFISDRVYQALEIRSKKKHSIPGVDLVWENLSKCFPAIMQVYERVGLDYKLISAIHKKETRQLTDKSFMWNPDTWDVFFSKIYSTSNNLKQKELSSTALEVLRSKTLTLDLLFKGLLTIDKTQLIKDENNQLVRKKVTSQIVNNILLSAGLKKEREHNIVSEKMTRIILDVFDDLKQQDASYSDQQFIVYFEGDKVRIAPFGFLGIDKLNEDKNLEKSFISRSNILQVNKPFSIDSISELEDLINKSASERDFQLFFERYPKYLLSLGNYSKIHSQIILHQDHGTKLIPDFFLEKINSDFCDILDLKKSNKELIRHQKNRLRFRGAIFEGLAQLRTYRDYFEERYNREKFKTTYGLNAYQPKVVLVIGRKQNFIDEVQRMRIHSDLPNWIELKTYDELLEKAKFWNSLG